MLFGLKNAKATYQRAMVASFHDMMHKEIEAYVDDMIVKSKTLEQHVKHVEKLFVRLRKYKMRLNLTKFLHLGIEVDLDKIKATREMLTLRTKSEVRGFLGRL
ncbi:Retrovirus-related Pol polyprotein from transposon 17.6, partial [Mucuna pruriens]